MRQLSRSALVALVLIGCSKSDDGGGTGGHGGGTAGVSGSGGAGQGGGKAGTSQGGTNQGGAGTGGGGSAGAGNTAGAGTAGTTAGSGGGGASAGAAGTSPDAGASPDSGSVTFGDPLTGAARPMVLEGANGQRFDGEGPLWIAAGNYLLFSDVSGGKIWKLDPSKPAAQRYTEVTYRAGVQTNGLALDNDGNVLVCERTTGKIGRLKLADNSSEDFLAGYAETAGGQVRPFKAPNDIIVRRDGNVYFTDPNYGTMSGSPFPSAAYRIGPNKAVTRIAGSDAFNQPNGIALSPDGNTLYIGDDGAGAVWKYDLNAAGEVGTGTRIIMGLQTPDGIAVDDAGNLYVTSNNGGSKSIRVFDRTGKPNTTPLLMLDGQPSNASFGGADRKTLYITTPTSGGGLIYQVKLAIPGLP